MNVLGAILAGGQSTRMGLDKALVEFRGAPMLDHVAAAIEQAGLQCLVVGRQAPVGGLRFVEDLPGIGGGPLVGLLSAFEAAEGRDLFLAAVDQPLLRPKTVTELINTPGDIVVPMAAGHPQVTCAVYRKASHGLVEELATKGQPKLRRLLGAVDTTYVDERTWKTWGEDGRSWLSLDTPQAVQDAEHLR